VQGRKGIVSACEALDAAEIQLVGRVSLSGMVDFVSCWE
jgi:hypothetical protein